MRTIKKFTPSYIVDIDEIAYLEDIDAVWALAKHNAGIPLTDDELEAIVSNVASSIRPKITVMFCGCKFEEKKPWYKRLWNWLFRK